MRRKEHFWCRLQIANGPNNNKKTYIPDICFMEDALVYECLQMGLIVVLLAHINPTPYFLATGFDNSLCLPADAAFAQQYLDEQQ